MNTSTSPEFGGARALLFALLLAAPSGGVCSQLSQLYVSHDPNTVGEYNGTNGSPINASLITTGLSTAWGLALSGGVLFVANNGNNEVGEYDATTGAVINASFITGLNGPSGLTLSGGNLYVSNAGGGSGTTVGEYNATTGATINASLVTGLTGPVGLAVSGTNLFVVNGGANKVGEYDATTGAPIGANGANFITGLNNPSGLVVLGLSDILIANGGTAKVVEYDTSGNLLNSSFISLPGTDRPSGLALSGNNLYVADFDGKTVGEYNATNGNATNASLVSGLSGAPYGLAVGTPEPGSAVLLALGASALLGWRRRRSV